MKVTQKTISALGVGRVDDSQSAEFSTQTAIQSYQTRYYWGLTGVLPPIPFPWVLGAVLRFLDEDGTVKPYGTKIPSYISDIIFSTSRNGIVYVALGEYEPPAPYVFIRGVGAVQSYNGRAVLKLKNALRTVEGKAYLVTFATWIGEPVLCDLCIYGIVGQKESV